MNSLCCLLSYIGEILVALKKSGDQAGSTSPPVEHEISIAQEIDSDWEEDLSHEEDDTAGEDSVSYLPVETKQSYIICIQLNSDNKTTNSTCQKRS